MNNIGLLHKECGNKRKQEWQEKNTNLCVLVNSYCKLAFEENGRVEHMWVLVTNVDNDKKEYAGTLDNDPFIITNVKFKDIVNFKFEDIEDYLPC